MIVRGPQGMMKRPVHVGRGAYWEALATFAWHLDGQIDRAVPTSHLRVSLKTDSRSAIRMNRPYYITEQAV